MIMLIDKEIGLRVKQAIIGSKMKVYEVGQKLGLKKATMTSYIIGLRHIPEENLKRIAELTNVSLQWLLTGADGEKQLYKVQRISTISEEKPFYPANSTFPEAIQLSEQQILEILKLKDSSPLLYKLLETVIERNQKLADYVAKLQSQNAADKQKE
jgi:transcriptional regulator with XRE-family HTH domain